LAADAGEWESAAANYFLAIEELPFDVRTALPPSTLIGEIIRAQPPVFEAFLKLRQDATRLLLCRGRLMAMRKDWKRAVEDYARTLPSGEEFFEHAGVRLLAGDRDGYFAIIRELAQRQEKSTDPFLAFVLARTAALGPESPVESRRMIALAEQAVAVDQQPWFLHAYGLVLYRAKRYDEAAARLEQSLAEKWLPEGAAQNHVALGLVRLRQGRLEESRQHVEKAREWETSLDFAGEGPPSVIVQDWLEYHILLREFEAAVRDNSLP
jgi:tetratricopeptide (TPR) repeat protein